MNYFLKDILSVLIDQILYIDVVDTQNEQNEWIFFVLIYQGYVRLIQTHILFTLSWQLTFTQLMNGNKQVVFRFLPLHVSNPSQANRKQRGFLSSISSNLNKKTTYGLIRDPLAVNQVLVLAGLVVLVVMNLPSSHRDVAESAAAHRHPTARRVVPIHGLTPDSDHGVSTAKIKPWQSGFQPRKGVFK